MKTVALCGLDHAWACEAQLLDYTPPRKQGRRRPRPSKQWFVVPSRCPACGHRWLQIKPEAVEIVEN